MPADTNTQVIVTGATGFVGQHLVPLLVQRGARVTALVRDPDRLAAFDWARQVQAVQADYHKEMPDLVPEDGARLVHLAWQGLPNYSARFHFEQNLPRDYGFVQGMVARGVRQVLVTGTCFEYGMQSGPLRADTPTRPANPYAFAKDALRESLTYLQAEHPFVLQWARLFYMYGPGQNPNAILAQLDRAIDAGAPVFNMSGGEQLRDYLPVAQVAARLVSLLETGTDSLCNICSGTPISIRALVERRVAERGAKIALNLGHYPYPTHEPMAFWGVPDHPLTTP